MPELIDDGPQIPTRLLNDLDEDRVVFFCGAGISAGRGSGLPDFRCLVCDVYAENRIVPDEVEQRAFVSGALDKTLGLLARSNRLGDQKMRDTVINQLSAPPISELNVHKALLDLSRTEKGVRLVTTNFDDRFVEAADACTACGFLRT